MIRSLLEALPGVQVDLDSPTTLPSRDKLFRALEFFPLEKTKVVILGQDPYPKREQACGLAFSVPEGQPIPHSLRNIFKEIRDDLGLPMPSSGDLTPWAKQGVLLLNALLTVQEGKPRSHMDRGWEPLTQSIVEAVLKNEHPVVVMCWGKPARRIMEKLVRLQHKKALFLEGGHPSPLNCRLYSMPFFGGRYFSMANAWLEKHGVTPVDWRLP